MAAMRPVLSDESSRQWQMLFRELDAIKETMEEIKNEAREDRRRIASLESTRSYTLGWAAGAGLVCGVIGAWLAKLFKVS